MIKFRSKNIVCIFKEKMDSTLFGKIILGLGLVIVTDFINYRKFGIRNILYLYPDIAILAFLVIIIVLIISIIPLLECRKIITGEKFRLLQEYS